MRDALILNLSAFHDLSELTIAQELKISAMTVKRALKDAKKIENIENKIKSFEQNSLEESILRARIRNILQNQSRIMFVKDVR